MNADDVIQRRLLFILHRALVEARLLAQAEKHQQVFDLSDALEQLPGWMVSWESRYLAELRRNLHLYAAKYPQAFCYLDYLDKFDPPQSF